AQTLAESRGFNRWPGVLPCLFGAGGDAMPKQFFHRDMELVIDHRFDWERYLRLRRGGPVNVADEVATYKDVLRTTAEICEAIEEGSRGHWHEAVKLENGKVVVPPHITAGYEKLRGATSRPSASMRSGSAAATRRASPATTT